MRAPKAKYTDPLPRLVEPMPAKRHTLKTYTTGAWVNIQGLPILPAWSFYTGTSPSPSPNTGAPAAWSHLIAPPAIGALVNIRINGIGAARVLSYFVDCGFLGAEVLPLNPPAWYVRQNGSDCSCGVFGAEIA